MSNRTGGDGFAMVAARHAMISSEAGSENYRALPSSYRRRIRKSRSLATVHQSSNLRLRIQRSVPFLRRQSTTVFHKSSSSPWERHDEAVQLARAQYFGGSDHHDTQELELYSFHKIDRKEHHKFRKSVRGSLTADAHLPPAVKRSSSFTATIRNRVRQVIGRTWNRKDTLPPQQLEAQRNYFSELDRDVGPPCGFDAYAAAEDTLRKTDFDPSVPEHDVLEDLDKVSYTLASATSHESLHSNGGSRVTSWTNSSMTGSIGLRSGLMERNRLSIIKEDGGPHQPSSSAGKHIGGVEIFREPLQPVTNDGVIASAVNTQRVYSALIKRINEEEAEVERTRLAVETLDQEREGVNRGLLAARQTVRAVQSDSSLATLTADHQSRRFSSRSTSWDLDSTTNDPTTDARCKENSGRARERLVEQESQSSFFPFSSEKSPDTPSPFKKFLNERRSRARNRSRSRSSGRDHAADADGASVIITRHSSNPVMNRPRFALSSASIYSRTTNGGSNDQYRLPVDSSEELLAPAHTGSESMGMASILPVKHASCDRSQWNPWSDPVDVRLSAPEHNPHTRERAQIRSEEDSASRDEMLSGNNTGGTPRADLNAFPGTETPKVRIDTAPSQAHDQLRNKLSADALSNISNKADDGSKDSRSLRKLSPGNLAKMFKDRKPQKPLRPQSSGKENSPAAREGSPPISTPGRLHLQFRNGPSTGRLRQKAGETAFYTRNGVYSTPQGSVSSTPSRSHESPSENAKHHLVARLSRPFNMDVPPHNRPFDSMYLGKRTFGHPDTFGDNRLSVAPRISEDVTEPNKELAPDETDAMPSRSYSAGRSAAKMFGLLGSKRMVSNFLKSRRGDRSTSAGEQNVANGSPAFI
ncbi:hypothetical protein G647_05015 [Cladophialophora carrionii CBS 160.54]|uniref:Uncharacterized protein n=1 Tax=Cladophialophora carrionii CBS 160.54 TaxID=1279043 RepID=V9DB66_9EURO|nr:uncharacterized protein G647_05015 [Cladophialophora carrionii CBS 160.54]ETI23217.1 hypothetical protein G647_05015 [Cladophialophora carrionii CBS 160.54]